MEQGFIEGVQRTDVEASDVTNNGDVITLDEENKNRFINALAQDYEYNDDEDEDESVNLESYLKSSESSGSSDVTSSSSSSESSSSSQEEDKPDHERHKHHGKGSSTNDGTHILSIILTMIKNSCYSFSDVIHGQMIG
jgi:hypothetical protein